MDVQQLFRNLQKEAECPLCLETVNNPKTLPCLHSFCLECLDKHAGFARRQLQATIKCPVCQTSFQIPEGDSFKNLPTSYHLNRLVDVLALKVARYSFSKSIPPKFERKLRRHKQRFGKIDTTVVLDKDENLL